MGMLGADPWTTFTQCSIKANEGFTGEAILSVLDARLGDYPRGSGNQQVRSLTVDGSEASPGVDGIRLIGPIQGFQIDDVCIYKLTTPRQGVIIENSPTYVALSNALIQGRKNTVYWDRSGTVSMHSVATRTDSPSGPSRVTMAEGNGR